MNYRHIYHAGMFADVFKHIVLINLIDYLKNKPAPFCYLDTHAGIGLYPLNSIEAGKTLEYQNGIEKIFHAKDAPKLIKHYLNLVSQFNDDTLTLYPGSPLIASELLREQDRAILCELHPEDYQTLKNHFHRDPQTAVHLQNGYHGLKAFLPPKEKRGLVLIDPPYEKASEFDDIINALKIALKAWPNGMYAIWYPIKANQPLKNFFNKIINTTTQSLLKIELSIYQADSPQTLNGSGILIINPPWNMEETLKESLAWLWKKLTIDEKSHFSIEWLRKN